MSRSSNTRTILASANNSIISKIIDLINLKSLNMTWTKVKAHEEEFNNELADDLAKEALELVTKDSSKLINLDKVEHNSLAYRYRCGWNNLDIDMNFRRFVKMVEIDKINTHWLLNKAICH